MIRFSSIVVLAALLGSGASAFIIRPNAVALRPATASINNKQTLVTQDIQTIVRAVNSPFQDDPNAGNRGEGFLAVQGILMISILVGHFPFMENLGNIPFLESGPLTLVAGTGLLLSGLYIMYLSGKELGGSLSHWAVPVDKSEGGDGLITTGVYGIVRHPMYIGLLAFMSGISLASNSALRLLLTLSLFVVLQLKATHEEEKLAEAYPEYEEYKQKVTSRILPFSMPLSKDS